MELIIISNSKCKSRKIVFNLSYLVILFCILSFITYFAYVAGLNSAMSQSDATIQLLSDNTIQARHRELKHQERTINIARENAINGLDALASRLSQLQGHIMRLDALGSRLVKMANIEDIDFLSVESPGMGGPSPSLAQDSLEVEDFIRELNLIADKITDREEKLEAVESMIMDRDLQEQTLPTGRPVNTGWISSLFGWRTDPINGKKEFHQGIDFASKPGSNVTSVAAGIVTWSGRRSGYGNLVEINHGSGYLTRYAHNKENLVNVGEKVEKGQIIAIMGSTGHSTGTHVHFEVINNGKQINPKQFISVN